MKILIIRAHPTKPNQNTYNLQEVGQAKALIRKGHQCDVMYFNGSDKDHKQTVEFDGEYSLNILWIRGFGVFKEGLYPSIGKYIKDYDILQIAITSLYLHIIAAEKCVNYHGPYYFNMNKGDIKKAKVFDKTLLPIINKNNLLVGTKSILATEYLKAKGIKKVQTIGVGLDLTNIDNPDSPADKHEFIECLSAEKERSKLILYIGAIEPRRNTLFLLDVFKEVQSSVPDSKLVLIGKGSDEYVTLCRKKISRLGLTDKVIFKERVEQKYLKSVYNLSDVFLLPTRYEIFGMVLLEAMYFKCPVITTYNGGSATLFNKENGIIIDEFDVGSWAEKIINLLQDEKLAESMGEAAHKTIVEGYTWDILADKFIELYNRRLELNKE